MNAPFVAELDHLAVLAFTGPEAQSFLQGQLSCDVREADGQHCRLASYSTPKGRMQASFILWQATADTYHLLVSADLAEATLKRLSMFILRAKVKTSLLSEAKIYGLVGAEARQTAAASYGLPVVTDWQQQNTAQVNVLGLPEQRAMVVLTDGTPLAPALLALPQASPTEWQRQDIVAAVPWITLPTKEMFVPQMCNLELLGGGISFQKGCYPGQEIVSRTQYIGKVKRRMFPAQVAAHAQAGQPLFCALTGEQTIGNIVSAVANDDGSSDVLAVVQASHLADGIHLGSPTGPTLSFAELPYALPA